MRSYSTAQRSAPSGLGSFLCEGHFVQLLYALRDHLLSLLAQQVDDGRVQRNLRITYTYTNIYR